MTTIAMVAVGVALLMLGFVGCVVPVLPGPILGYCALLALMPTSHCPSTTMLVVMGLAVVVVTVADYVVPLLGAKTFQCTRWGTVGCFVGTIAGMAFFPVGLVLGPFLGAFLGELIAGRSSAAAARGGVGALLGFLAGVFMKIVVCLALAAAFVCSLM